jgi:hypothetical protein
MVASSGEEIAWIVPHHYGADLPKEQESLAREIQSTDRESDRLVYELYGLTEDEIRIVEGV